MSASVRYILCQVQSAVFDYMYYTNKKCSSVTPTVDNPSRFTSLKGAYSLLFHFQNFMDHLGTIN